MNPKSLLTTLLALFVTTNLLIAAPMLKIEVSIFGLNSKGQLEVVAKPTAIAESGKSTTLEYGNYTIQLSPQLRADKTVKILTKITKKQGESQIPITKKQCSLALGASQEITMEKLAIAVTPSLLP